MPKRKPAARKTATPATPATPPPARKLATRSPIDLLRSSGVTGKVFSAGAASDVSEFIPSGINAIDRHLLGGGGLPVGRLVELAGDEGTGKTSLAFAFVAGAQQHGGAVQYVESEQALQAERAEVFGVDLDRVLLDQPATLEEALVAAETFMRGCIKHSLGPNLWVYDTLAAGVPKAELDAGVGGGATVGLVARLMSQKLRMLTPLAVRSRTAILVLNQTRQKIGLMFGNPTTTPGGNAIKFYASARIMLMGGSAVKVNGAPVGKDVTAFCAKNKFQKPGAKARLRLSYDNGWEEEWATLNFAKDAKLAPGNARGRKAYEAACAALAWPVQFTTQGGSAAGGESDAEVAEEMGLVEDAE